MSADLQFKQYIDRILRCREAEDAAKEDTKEVYAEMKAAGYDKTAAGALVAELRKREKNPDQFSERSAILDLYRDAYERASHAHTREDNLSYSQSGLSYAAEKGSGDASLIGTVTAGMQTEIGRKALVTALDIMIEREETGEITDTHVQPVGTLEASAKSAQDDVGATASSTYSITPPTKGESDAKSAHDDSVSEKLLIFGAGQVSGAAFAAAKETGNTTERQPSNDLQNAPAESAADAISATHSNSTAVPSAQSDSAGEAPSSPASPATHSDDLEIPAFLRRDEGRGYTKHEASA